MGFPDRLKYLILQYVWLMSTNWLHATYQDLQHGAKQTRTRYRMSFSGFSYIFDQINVNSRLWLEPQSLCDATLWLFILQRSCADILVVLGDIPGSGQEHGLLDEHWSREQDVPAAADVIRTGGETEERRNKGFEEQHTEKVLDSKEDETLKNSVSALILSLGRFFFLGGYSINHPQITWDYYFAKYFKKFSKIPN